MNNKNLEFCLDCKHLWGRNYDTPKWPFEKILSQNVAS